MLFPIVYPAKNVRKTLKTQIPCFIPCKNWLGQAKHSIVLDCKNNYLKQSVYQYILTKNRPCVVVKLVNVLECFSSALTKSSSKYEI